MVDPLLILQARAAATKQAADDRACSARPFDKQAFFWSTQPPAANRGAGAVQQLPQQSQQPATARRGLYTRLGDRARSLRERLRSWLFSGVERGATEAALRFDRTYYPKG